MAKLRSSLWMSLAAVCALATSPAELFAPVLGQRTPAFLTSGVAVAKDVAELHRDLAQGSDFRLRVSAALALGQMGQRASVPHLARALADPHPAVRAAASAALGKIGDASAAPAVEAAAAREQTASVRAQHQATLAKLRSGSAAGPAAQSARFVVKLGKLANKTGVRSAEVDRVFRESTRAQVSKVPGALVPGEREDATSVARARSLPVVALDGSISRLTNARSGSDVGWDAQVEYLITQMPQQQLKGTIKGRGKALASAAAVGPSEQAQLQQEAVSAAVQSALADASGALTAATR